LVASPSVLRSLRSRALKRRLVPPPPPLPAERVDRREDLEALKTHLPSNQNSLEAREETRSVASLPCSAFISGELLIGLAGGSAW
jgi:hypothetical protein